MNKKYFVLISVLFVLIFSSKSYVSAAGKNTFGVGPLMQNDRYPSWFIEELRPGESVEEGFFVKSDSDKILDFRVYAQDAENVEKDSSFKAYSEGQTPQEKQFLQNWITISEPKITVKPYGYKELVATITVPKDAKPGEYAGVVFVHLDPSAADIESFRKSDQSTKQTTLVGARVGVRTFVTVSDNPNPPRKFKPIPAGQDILKYIFLVILLLGIVLGIHSIYAKDIKRFFKKKLK